MYAIVEVAGKQCKVQEKQTVEVPRLQHKEGDSIQLDRVLFIGGSENVQIGKPFLSNASVTATVLSHGKGDKVLIFKKKRRKNYKVLRGHRQPYTKIRIEKISTK